jgi:hypothetical protein
VGDDTAAKGPEQEAEEDEGAQAAALVAKVERGELARDALELLAAVGHAPSRRALGRLELVLTSARPAVALDELPAGQDDAWLRWGARFEPFARPVAVAVAHAIARELPPLLEDGADAAPAQLAGLHTGPAGALVLGRTEAAEVFPLARTAGRVLDATARWLEGPSEAGAGRVDAAWPPLLRVRSKAAFLCELARQPWAPAWALRWLVATVCGPEAEVGAAVGYVATFAHEALGDRAPVRRAARGALVAAFLGRGGGRRTYRGDGERPSSKGEAADEPSSQP